MEFKKIIFILFMILNIFLILSLLLITFIGKKNISSNIANNLRNLIEIKCQTGDENKCLSCDKELNECTSCNPMFNLKNGICEPNYSIRAVYQTTSKNQKLI
jgi:hypothetical protein